MAVGRAYAARMGWDPRQLGEQTGRTFAVTGANSGIGLEAARGLVGRGADVVLLVRGTADGERAAASIAGTGSTSVVGLDLSDLDQVADCATRLLDRHDDLAAVICNAGVMGGPLLFTPQGFERQMATNHLGHAALVAALWPLLQASGSRVVAGFEHRGAARGAVAADDSGAAAQPGAVRRPAGLPEHQAGQPPVCAELHRRCGKAGSPVSAVAVHPGASATNLFARQLERAGRGAAATVSKVVTGLLLQSAAAGALSTLRALDPTRRVAPSSAPPDSASFAAGRSCSTCTPPPRTRSQPRACGSSPSRRSAGRYRSERSPRHPRPTTSRRRGRHASSRVQRPRRRP